MKGPHPTIVWLRRTLRRADNPALAAAVRCGGPVIPVFILPPDEQDLFPLGAASRWWLSQSLGKFGEDLRQIGSRLVLRAGPAADILRQLVHETGAGAVFFDRLWDPALRASDERLVAEFRVSGIHVERFNGSLLFEPTDLRTGAGGPYKVFTPFWQACRKHGEPAPPEPAPARLPSPARWPHSLKLADLDLSTPANAPTMRQAWTPGERGAADLLDRFLDQSLVHYETGRDRPEPPGTSRLSPHLHFGEISPRQVWHSVRERAEFDPRPGMRAGAEAFLRQLAWREFAWHLLHHFPHTIDTPLRPAFEHFPWEPDAPALTAWQTGRTGYPLVDAGMRELAATGWMHNRVRMLAASFLVKDLLIPWQEGARWFWQTLVDADLANNTLGWQWVAGCGADASPFFRIFNPVTQSEKFDPEGLYIRRWVPELARLEGRWIHQPWRAPEEALQKAALRLDETYPRPIVDHHHASRQALILYRRMKDQKRAIPSTR